MAKKRLIDAYDLAETIKNMRITVAGKPARWDDAKHSVLREIAQAPDVDAVEVVRCKDCNGYDKHRKHCNYCGSLVFDDDFCSHGKRKEGADK